MRYRILILTAVLALGISCTKNLQETDTLPESGQSLAGKLVGGTDGEIVPGTILVKLGEDAVSEGDLELVLMNTGADAIRPAVPVKARNMEAFRKYGLHRWYALDFNESVRPEEVALKAAAMKEVSSIQYSKTIKPVRTEEAYPFEAFPMTKSTSSASTFDDPYASHQWNLVNDGSFKGSVAGADVGVKDAWRLTGGDPSVIVAVFDCAVAYRHEDLADAVWKNDAEISGESGKDDDGNGFIDDKYGFNFVKCYSIDEDYANGLLDKEEMPAVSGEALNSTKGVGHGTHVAGIIGAVNGNGKGVSSIAGGTGKGDGVRLMSCQIFNGSDYAVDAQNAAAFVYAADNGACIAQCSYGTANIITEDDMYINGGTLDDGAKVEGSPLETAALMYFLDPSNSNHESLKGNIAVFAAGNHSNPYSSYPGALSEVISVTAFGYDWLPGGYTNYGPGCNIAAPGGEWKGVKGEYDGMILSTGLACSVSGGYPGLTTDKGESKNYVYMQGTSMACPHVSGVLALGIAYAKKLGKTFSREEMTSMLLTSVNDIDQYNKGGSKNFYPPFSSTPVSIDMSRFIGRMGTGAVDAWKFLMAIEGTPSVMVKAGEKATIDLEPYCNPQGTYTMSMDDASRKSLGLTEDPVIRNGMLEITCTAIGAGKITLTGSVGKDPEKEDGIGGMDYSREISIVSRPFVSSNGGWL
ncbi:MAG: S8 family serine peptidase [Bacteroidales bacterium]|nr:S8 family serine peptidase [Bacteroidales bacterium]